MIVIQVRSASKFRDGYREWSCSARGEAKIIDGHLIIVISLIALVGFDRHGLDTHLLVVRLLDL